MGLLLGAHASDRQALAGKREQTAGDDADDRANDDILIEPEGLIEQFMLDEAPEHTAELKPTASTRPVLISRS